jgi:hypothetical protein
MHGVELVSPGRFYSSHLIVKLFAEVTRIGLSWKKPIHRHSFSDVSTDSCSGLSNTIYSSKSRLGVDVHSFNPPATAALGGNNPPKASRVIN